MDRSPLYPLRGLLALLPCVAMLLGVVGCQNNQHAYRDIYLRELRLQEDEIYRLEDCIEEYQGLIRNYRAEVAELKTQTGVAVPAATAPRPAPAAPRSLLDGGGSPALGSPGLQRIDPPADDDLIDEDDSPFDVPAIDLGEPMAAPPRATSDPVAPPPLDVPALDTPATDPPALDPPPLPQPTTQPPAPRSTAPPAGVPPIDIPPLNEGTTAPLPDSRYGPAEELPPLSQSRPAMGDQATPDWARPEFAGTLPAEPLGGLTVQGYAGPPLDSGEPTLVTLIRPQTLLGEPARFAGQASLMLIDPRVGQGGQKLARWDFTAEEVAASWRDDTPQPVLDLAVVLPSGVPLDEELELWVRLVDEPNDQKVLDQTPVMLGRLASLDEATLADAGPTAAPVEALEPLLDAAEQPAAPEELTGWRASDRAPLAAAQPGAADSGWRRSDEPVEPRKIRLATHVEPTPLPLPPAQEAAEAPAPAAKTAAPAGGEMDWSPTR